MDVELWVYVLIIINWLPDANYRLRTGPSNDGVKIANVGKLDGKRDKSKVECFDCHKLGHYSIECTDPNAEPVDKSDKNKPSESGVQMLNAGLGELELEDYDECGFSFHQNRKII